MCHGPLTAEAPFAFEPASRAGSGAFAVKGYQKKERIASRARVKGSHEATVTTLVLR